MLFNFIFFGFDNDNAVKSRKHVMLIAFKSKIQKTL
jgi:hypothetical protein